MKTIKQSIHTTLLTFTFLITSLSANAVLIPTELSINGEVELSTLDSVGFFGDGSQSATMSSVLGGALSDTFITDISVAGANPQGGTFVDLGDSVSVNTDVVGRAESAAGGFIFDFAFSLLNSSLTDAFQLTFELLYDNTTSAEGDDVYVDSEIILEDSAVAELFASDLTTDTFFGDSVNGAPTGTAGVTQNQSGSFVFNILLAPGASDSFTGLVKIDGEEFVSAGTFSAMANAQIRLNEVLNLAAPPPPPPSVDEPYTALLFLAALTVLFRRKQTQ